MTKLGAMLYNDGINDGIERGIERGERQKLQELAKTVYQKGVPIDKIAELFDESIELISDLIKNLN